MSLRISTLCSLCLSGSVFLFLFLQSSSAHADEIASPISRPFRSQLTGEDHNYMLYLPSGYDADAIKEWPVILFLHGAGESGDGRGDLPWVYAHGPLYEALVQRRDLPFIMIAPQLPVLTQGQFVAWREGKAAPAPTLAGEMPPARTTFHRPVPIERITGPEPYPGKEFTPGMKSWEVMTDDVMAILDEVLAEYRADADRVYLTGLSLGGLGSLDLAAKHPDRWAAIAPVVGVTPMTNVAPIARAGRPMWLFGGGQDRVVKVHWLYELARALKKAGHPAFRFTVHEDLGHDAFVRVYAGDDVYSWFLEHRRGETRND